MRGKTAVVVVALGLLGVSAGGAVGQRASAGGGGGGGGDDRSGPGGELRAVERRGGIRIDGRLSEDAWDHAPAITEFVQGEPVEGSRPGARTEVRILFDDQAIYVGARLFESDPARIARQLVRRDETGQADYFEVAFDPDLDRRTGYLFRVSAAGVERDAYLYADNREDPSWDAVWDSEVRVDGDGWSVELRIPWSQIRYQRSDTPQTWGVNFVRWRTAAGERTYYALVPRSRHGRVSFFRRIEGVRAPASGQRVELRPYALARGRLGPDRGDPFFDGSETSAQAGLDLRYGLGSAFTLDATVNPDFGQVELDPAVINLSAFESFFPEKRPFFVEDARILDFDLSGRRSSLFYSRRIGRTPQGHDPDSAVAVDVPEQSTILGAAKLTGRTADGLALGGLLAATAAEEGRAYFEGDGAASGRVAPYLAQPAAYHAVIRARQDLRGGATTVGGIATGIRRDLPGDGSFDFLASDAYGAGVDVEHTWGDREWALEGFLAVSLVRGDPAALVRLQESSGHYFQRPDSDFGVDSSRTALAGAEWRLQLERRSGEHWTGALWAGEVTPGLEVNDLGYSRSSEQLGGGARIAYREIRPGPVFRGYVLSVTTDHDWRHAALDAPLSGDAWRRARKSGTVRLSGQGALNNFWGGGFDVRYAARVLDGRATRGGPLMVAPARLGTGLRVHTDPRAPVTLTGSFDYDTGAGGQGFRGGLGMSVRPSEGWEIQVEPRYAEQEEMDQYVGAFEDADFRPTYGRRYLFGRLERRSVSVETRVNVTFTPDLTLQLFAQPLVEAGAYSEYRQLSEAASYRFTALAPGDAVDADGDGVADRCAGGAICRLGDEQYLDFDGDGVVDGDFEDRDFNVVSLRGNAVLRWEYRPGSTLFLVWQQRREGRREFGDLDLGRDGSDVVGIPADNVFIVKASYWLGL